MMTYESKLRALQRHLERGELTAAEFNRYRRELDAAERIMRDPRVMLRTRYWPTHGVKCWV